MDRKVRRLIRLAGGPEKALLTEIGEYAMFRIKARTAEGKDVDGQAFEEYSPGHRRTRERLGHPVDKVNLFMTGSMMAAMNFTTDSNSVELFFLNTTDDSGSRNPEKAFWLNENRNFFSLSEEDVSGIVNMINQYYRKEVRRKA